MKRILNLLILSIVFMPFKMVNALNYANMKCSNEAMIGNTITCEVKMNSEEKITGILGKLEYDNVFTYEESIVSNDTNEIVNNSKGFACVNLNGYKNDETIEKIKFIVSNKAEPKETYKIKIKDIELTNGEKDIENSSLEQEVKILSIKEVLKSLKVNEHNIELKDGVTNYTVTIDNVEKDANINAELTSNNYSFTEGKGPRTLKDLKEKENNKIEIEIQNEEMKLVKFNLNIIREEAIKTDTPLEINPQTGMILTLAIPLLIGLIIVFVREYKKIRRKQL